ncbi:hypothetical protein PoB_006194000 [Plakobranchus ocellatus]|uniref:Profilin n=1 Tax=Plakobranchus ocellatus TaxID=259542 RepID=A0AAV4CUG8_9GAST|nr:hypothetical protein PoB_006194000 [Plakobranchus ocellatus]
MSAVEKATWDQFVSEHLLQTGIFSGLALVAVNGNIVYSYGCLNSLDKEEVSQFLAVFGCSQERATILKLNLGQENLVKTTFRIYHQNHISMYATSAGNQKGITLSRLPQGIFITVFGKPALPHQAICAVEKFSERLRF